MSGLLFGPQKSGRNKFGEFWGNKLAIRCLGHVQCKHYKSPLTETCCFHRPNQSVYLAYVDFMTLVAILTSFAFLTRLFDWSINYGRWKLPQTKIWQWIKSIKKKYIHIYFFFLWLWIKPIFSLCELAKCSILFLSIDYILI